MSTKRKAPSRIAPPVVKASARIPTKTAINEKGADVTTAEMALSAGALSKPQTIDISSDSESEFSDEEAGADDEDQEMGEAGRDEAEAAGLSGKSRVNGEVARPAAGSTDDADAATEGTESDGENAAPSFGDLLREQQTIDVDAAMAGEDGPAGQQGALVAQGGSGSRALAAPSASSLGTVLNQALRTDDTELLESCFGTHDIAVVHNTIERLDSGLAGSLLVHLATRLHRRPGRAGTLMHWVQWTLVVHGGALAAQPEVLAKLASLQKVLAVRARGLNSLLILKGKLDLLESQLKLRKRVQARQAIRGGADGDSDDEDEEDENVIYVDGGGDDADGVGARRNGVTEDDDDVDDVLLMNGIAGDSDDEEDDGPAVDEDEEGEESLDEDEVNYDDVDESMGDDDESDVEAAPPTKKLKSSLRTK